MVALLRREPIEKAGDGRGLTKTSRVLVTGQRFIATENSKVVMPGIEKTFMLVEV